MSRSVRTLMVVGLLAISTTALADEPKTVAEIQVASDRTLIRDLLDYLAKHPKADDADQAYMKVFDKVIEHDWFLDHEAVARKYLTERPDGPVRSLAQIVATMARADAGKYAEAFANFEALMTGISGPEQEEFALNFADTLANSATAAGETQIARKVFETLARKFAADSPNLAQRVKNELAHLDQAGRPVPNVTVVDLSDATFRLSDLKGKYVLVNFWSTWAAPSVAEVPRLQANYAKYKDKGFEIVSVSLDETKSAVVDFVRARKLPWKQVHNGTSNGDLVEAFAVATIPATFLIDPKGTIIRLDLQGPALDKALQTLIK